MTNIGDADPDLAAMLERQGRMVSAQQRDAFDLSGVTDPMDTSGSVFRLPGYKFDEYVSTRCDLLRADPTGGAFVDPPTIIVAGLWAAAIHGAIWSPSPTVHVRTGVHLVDSPLIEIDPVPAEPFTPIRVELVPVLSFWDTYRWVVLEWSDAVNTGRWIDDLVSGGKMTMDELEAATPAGGECATAAEFREVFLFDVGNW